VIDGPIVTPWRVVMISKDLNALVNSDMVGKVAEPSRVKDASWIRPGRAVWKYLDGGENTLETVREFSRLAGQLGFEYQVVEGFWQKWSKEELKAVIAESRKQGVGLWLWKHSNQLRTAEARKAFFDLCAEVGAAGVKIDFFDHEAKEVVDLYDVYLREAAERRLLVNFHGANKPSGQLRTWPNELTREAVRGMESSKAIRARHDATIRSLPVAVADSRPCTSPWRNDTTWAHQIATAVVFSSPLLTFAANPANIAASPAVEVIKTIPAVWDETRVLECSEIGKVAGFARRKGNDWFVAVVNGTDARNVKVNLGFLGKGSYGSVMVKDKAGDTGAVELEARTMTRGETVTVDMQPGGGWVARFRK